MGYRDPYTGVWFYEPGDPDAPMHEVLNRQGSTIAERLADLDQTVLDAYGEAMAQVVADDQTVRDAAAAAMGDAAVQAQLAWQRRPLATSENLDQLTEPGIYETTNTANALSIVNAPAGIIYPFRVRVERSSTVNGILEQLLSEYGATGPVVWQRQRLGTTWGVWRRTDPARAWDRRGLSTGVGTVRWWGDSLVEASTLPESLDALIAEAVVDAGRSGDTANEVLLRAGVLTLAATGTIPASGAVDLTVTGQRLGLRDNRTFSAWFAGIPGTLTHLTADTWRFTRTATGTAVAVTTPTRLAIVDPPAASDVHLFLMGENDLWWNATAAPPEGDLVEHVVAAYQRAIDAVPASSGERHVLVGGVKTAQSTVAGDAKAQSVAAINDRLRAAFPAYYVDRQQWLVKESLAAAGITPTAADTAAMAAGLIPPSAFVDDLHIKPAVAAAEAQRLWLPALATRGWVTPSTALPAQLWKPAPTPASPARLTAAEARLTALEYDTGWRSIPLPTGTGNRFDGTGEIHVRRRGGPNPAADVVDVRLINAGVFSSIAPGDYLTPASYLPAGFRAWYSERARYILGNTNGSADVSIGVQQGSRLNLGRTGTIPGTGSAAIQGTFTFPAADARPTTLPGTASTGGL